MTRRILCLALMWGVVALAAPPVGAEVSLAVGPALLDVAATPGAHGLHELTVSNTGNDPVDATVIVELVGGMAGDRSAVDWLTVTPTEVHLVPGTEQTIAVELAVPTGLDSGGRYAKVTITTKAPPTSGNAAAIAGQLVVGVLVTVNGEGELVRSAEVVEFAPVLEPDGRIGFRALVQNGGNVHLVPKGEITVSRAGSDPLGSLEFQGTTPHLPGSAKLLATQGSLPLEPEIDYRAKAIVTYEDGDDNHAVEASTAFTLDPSLAIAEANACENLDRGPTMRVGLSNGGTVALEPTVSLTVRTASAALSGSVTVPGRPIVWPGDSATLSVDLPERLESGEYILVAQATYGPGLSVEHQTPFQIGGLDGEPIPLCAESGSTSAPSSLAGAMPLS